MSVASAAYPEAPAERQFWPRRNWWLALLAILLLAGALRYPGYDFSLPYPSVQDEMTFALTGRMIIDFGSAKSIGHHHYPPGIIHIYYLVLRLFHDLSLSPASVIWIVRLIAITTSLATVTIIALFGYQALGPPAGLLGAALWSISPFFVEHSRWGTAEIFVAFFTTLALYSTVVAMLYRREQWSTIGVYSLMLSIVFKYTCFILIPIALFLPLWRRRISRRRALENTVRFALFTAWLLLLTPLLDSYAGSENVSGNTDWLTHSRLNGLPFIRNLISNLRHTITGFEWQALAPGWLGLLLLWVMPERRGRQKALLALLPLSGALLLWPAALSVFGAHALHNLRWLFAWISLTVMLAGWGYALIFRALARYLSRHPLRYQRAGMGGALLLLAVILLPGAIESIGNLQRSLWEDPRNFVRDYAANTLASGRYISSRHSNLLNPDWGGYQGANHFELASFDHFTERPIAYWQEHEVDYAIIHHSEYEQLLADDPDGYLSQTTRLKGWQPRANYRWGTMVVLRLQPIQHGATGRLGPIRLIGYELSGGGGSVRAGQTLSFHLYWQATAPTETDYQIFNHLLDGEGKLVAQIDGPPLPDPLLRRGTSAWDDPEEILYSREYALALPEGLAPGEYSLITGFYRHDDGQRLLTPTGEDSLWLARIEVQ